MSGVWAGRECHAMLPRLRARSPVLAMAQIPPHPQGARCAAGVLRAPPCPRTRPGRTRPAGSREWQRAGLSVRSAVGDCVRRRTWRRCPAGSSCQGRSLPAAARLAPIGAALSYPWAGLWGCGHPCRAFSEQAAPPSTTRPGPGGPPSPAGTPLTVSSRSLSSSSSREAIWSRSLHEEPPALSGVLVGLRPSAS